jgi:hypothetical protein
MLLSSTTSWIILLTPENVIRENCSTCASPEFQIMTISIKTLKPSQNWYVMTIHYNLLGILPFGEYDDVSQILEYSKIA